MITNQVNLFYTALKDEVSPIWRGWEDKLFLQQPIVESALLDMYKKDPTLAIEFITNYSCDKAEEALMMAKKMTTRLHTIIAHYNAPL